MKLLKRTIITLFILLFIFLAAFLYLKPRLQILAGYVAKNVCSSTFVANRAAEQIRKEDVGYRLLKYAHFEIDKSEKSVNASILGIVHRKAYYREGLGCYLKSDSADLSILKNKIPTPSIEVNANSSFPIGDLQNDIEKATVPNSSIEKALDQAFEAVGTRAIVVVQNNQIIAERYQEGFDENTPQLGWSMSKSIVNALVGILVQQEKLELEQAAPVAAWQYDERRNITINHLLQMNSGLDWVEDYTQISDATKMLFRSPSMGKYAIHKKAKFKPNEHWLYASGTSNILSEIIRQQFDSEEEYWNFPYEALLHKINAYSFQLEADQSGTYVGSSYTYATPRDWARFGLLYLNDGVWNGERILPEDWINYTKSIAPNSEGEYGAHFWLNHSGKFPNAPADLYYCGGFDGQYVFVIPSRNMVIVRLGVDGLGEMNADLLLEGVLRK